MTNNTIKIDKRAINRSDFNEVQERCFYFETYNIGVKFYPNHVQELVAEPSPRKCDWLKGLLSKVSLTGEPERMKGNLSTRAQLYTEAKALGVHVKVQLLPDGEVLVSSRNKNKNVESVMEWIHEMNDEQDFESSFDVSHLSHSERANIYSKCRDENLTISMKNNVLYLVHPDEVRKRQARNTTEPKMPFTKVFDAWVISAIKPVNGFTTTLPVEVSSQAESMDHLRQTIYAHPYMLTFNPVTFEITFNTYKLKGTMGGTGLMRWTPAHGVALVFFDPDVKPAELRNPKPTMRKLAFINKCTDHGIDFNEVLK